MLTRLEVNGFKNLVDFSLDFGPYTCIAGPNGVGKSNIFDAIRFLSLLSCHTINEAALFVRGAGSGSIEELFFSDGEERRREMEFAAEMLVSRQVWDAFGREATPSASFLRYELAFRYEPPASATRPLGGLVLVREELRPITEGRAGKHLRFPHSKIKFRDSAVYNRRHARSGFVSTNIEEDREHNSVVVHQDSGAQGWGRPSPAAMATRTAVGTENTAATPTILAARVEMESWRVFALDPKALRKPDRYTQRAGISDDGSHVSATLQHLSNASAGQEECPTVDPLSVVASRLADVAPIKAVRAIADDVDQIFTLAVEETNGLELEMDAMSDGTLRFLALSTIAAGLDEGGLICVEEPENGIYPANLAHVNQLFHEIVADPNEEVNGDNLLRQVIVATHSPGFVELQDRNDLVLAQWKREPRREGQADSRVLECVPHRRTWRCNDDEHGFDLESLEPFASRPQSTQIAFPREVWEPQAL